MKPGDVYHTYSKEKVLEKKEYNLKVCMINDREREMTLAIPQTNEKLERLKIKKNFLEDC